MVHSVWKHSLLSRTFHKSRRVSSLLCPDGPLYPTLPNKCTCCTKETQIGQWNPNFSQSRKKQLSIVSSSCWSRSSQPAADSAHLDLGSSTGSNATYQCDVDISRYHCSPLVSGLPVPYGSHVWVRTSRSRRCRSDRSCQDLSDTLRWSWPHPFRLVKERPGELHQPGLMHIQLTLILEGQVCTRTAA